MDPIAFQLGGFAIHWYGVLVALGFLAGLWTASRRAPLGGIPADRIADLGPWLIAGGILGARLLYVLTYWNTAFAGRPWYEVLMIHKGGLVFYGGLIGATLATVIFARLKKIPLWALADVLAPSISLGQVFGRLGCLMNGCCFGHASAAPWAIRFPADHETAGQPVHPTQVYEAGLSALLYAGLAALFRRKRFDGQVFAVYLVAYPLVRSVVEVFRGDYKALSFGVLTPAHWVSAGILAAGLLLWWKLPRTLAPPAGASSTK